MTAIPDAVLLQRFREGDEACFEALFLRYYDLVYGVLFRLIGSRAGAEDLAQEVFLKLYRRPLPQAENVAGWLYRVAVHTGYNALRAEQRRLRRERASLPDRPPSLSAESEVLRREQQDEVRAVLAQLPERAASLLVLREMGLSYAELAAITGVAPGSVGKLLARARQAFERAYRRLPQAGHQEEDADDASS